MHLTTRWRVLLLTLPIAFYVAFLLLPLLNMGATSLHDFDRLHGTGEGYSTVQYRTIFGDGEYASAIVTTLRIAGITAVTTTLLGAGVAYVVWRQGGRLRQYILLICLVPLMVSTVVRAYGWVATTGPNGLLSRIGELFGVHDLTVMFNEPAVILGFLHVLLPYGVMMTLVNLEGIKPSIVKAAANLGAGEGRRLRSIVGPLAYMGIASSLLLTFALACAAYTIPIILGGRTVRTASVVIYQEQQDFFNWPRSSAVSLLLIGIVLITMVAYQVVSRRSSGRARNARARLAGNEQGPVTIPGGGR